MEVEVKLRFANAESHHRVTTLLSPLHVITHHQHTSSSTMPHLNSLLAASFFVFDSTVTTNNVLFRSKQRRFLSTV
ncbi:unnamed protein product [Lathyrus oleraceus]